MNPIDELVQPVDTDQVNDQILDNLETVGLKARSWRQAGSLRTIIKVISIIIAAFSSIIANAIRGQFLDLAEGGWLKWLAYYVYDVARIEATFATGEVTLTNTGGGIFSNVQPGALVVRAPSTGKTYRNTEVFSLGIGESKTIPVEAFELGSASSIGAGLVNEVVTQYFDGVECSNAAAIVGTDVEKNEDLRQRCRDSRGAKGTRSAYRFATRSARRVDGSSVGINRDRYFIANGTVRVVCANAAGPPSVDDLKDVRSSIEDLARVDTDTVIVDAATPKALTGTIHIWVPSSSGLQAPTLVTASNAATTAMMATYPIGGYAKTLGGQGYVWATAVEAAVKSVHPAIYDVDLEGGDIPLDDTDVATLASTVQVHFVSVPS